MTTKRNGTKPEPSPGVRLPKRTASLALNGDYSGIEITIWVNPPTSLWQSARENPESTRQLLGELILAWNLLDYDGNPMPLPNEGGSWDALPIDFQLLIDQAMTAKIQEVTELPKAPIEQ